MAFKLLCSLVLKGTLYKPRSTSRIAGFRAQTAAEGALMFGCWDELFHVMANICRETKICEVGNNAWEIQSLPSPHFANQKQSSEGVCMVWLHLRVIFVEVIIWGLWTHDVKRTHTGNHLPRTAYHKGGSPGHSWWLQGSAGTCAASPQREQFQCSALDREGTAPGRRWEWSSNPIKVWLRYLQTRWLAPKYFLTEIENKASCHTGTSH